MTATYGQASPGFTPPTKTGYDFDGYSLVNYKSKKILNKGGTFVANYDQYTQDNKWISELETLTLDAIWNVNEYTLTLNPNYDSEPSISASITYDNNGITPTSPAETIVLQRTGYTFNGYWTAASDGTQIIDANGALVANVSDYTGGNGIWKKDGDATLYAQWSENMTTVTVSSNNTDWGTVNVNSASVGVATTATLTATKNSGYKFVNWTLDDGAVLASGQLTDATITIKGNGIANSTGTAVATFEEDLSTGIYLQSNGITPTAWTDLEAFEFKKLTGQSTSDDVYLTITTTEDEQYKYVNGGTDNNQFILHDTKGAEGKRILSLKDGYWFVNSYAINTTLSQFGSSGYQNMRFFSTVPGTYTFHYNLSTHAFDIAYPNQYSVQICDASDRWTANDFVNDAVNISLAAESHIRFRVVYQGAYYGNTGTMTKDNCSGWTMTNNSDVRKECWINTAKAGGYTFTFDIETKKLTVTYPEETFQTVTVYEDGITPKEVKVYEVTKPSITAQVPEGMNFNGWVTTGGAEVANASSTTTTVTNAGTNGTVKATFNTNQYIYFKDGVNGKFGNVWVTFRQSDYWDDKNGSGNKDLAYAAQGMTKIKNTDIHYFRIADDKMSWKEVTNGIVQFTNSGNIQQNFYLTKVAYPHHNNSSSCYRGCLPLFVPRDWITDINSSQYYNDGIWMKYNSTESGFRIKGSWDSWTSNDYKFVAETPGGYEFRTTLTLAAGTTYDFKIYDEDGRTYSIAGVMTATSCTNWHMYMNQNNCQITTSEAGEYTFVLNLGSGEVIVSVEYPLSKNDYHVVAKQGETIKWEGDLIKNSGSVAKKDTTSFFNNQYTYQLQQFAGGNTWNNVGSEVTVPDDKAQVGVINLIVEQDGQGNATLAFEGIYTGNYYIRTDGVDGGWGSYKTNTDNKMDNYGSLIDADPDYQYDVYKAKWVPSGKNVKFRIANDYSKAISGEFTTDVIIDNKETLPEGANVRFMWNSTTNELKRAYLSGSTDDEKRYLMLINTNSKMYDKTGETQIDELKFADNNNWVYQADIQAQPGCEVKLTAQYNSKVQYFIGSETTTRKIIDGDGEGMYSLRAVYDFKTNRLVAGWIPNGQEIKDNIVLGSDMLIERTGQGDASQIVFGGASAASLSISNIQHIYGVLKLTKESMLTATESTFDKCVYWISFPFDVKVSEIFGVEKYGEVWAITKYNGEKRAEKGWFKQDTQTFWEFLKPSDIMKANVGYTLNLDPDYFNKESSEPWKSSATEVAWYFPSIKENVGVVSLAQKDTTLKPLHCDIGREFKTEDGRTLNHKFTDSNWRVIGVPAFQNLEAPTFTPEPTLEQQDKKTFGLTGFYEWIPSTNTYTVRSASGYTFKATGAYMVQYEGKITWSNAAVITTSNKAPWNAPEYAYADAKNYSIRLEFGNDDYTDQTFITLIEKASTDFVLNEDMMKIDNAGFPNIYSFAGAYNVAYNETTFDNQTVMLGVSAPKDGSYTFAMPKDFSGSAILVDLESGEATDLNLSDYTIDLNKGTYNNRFQLLLEVEEKTPTNMNPTKGEWSEDGKTKKLLINDNIYLINAGRIYNASGTQVK